MISLWFRTWLIGAKSMALHPMRSGLTVLGIFIGVASVIWLLAIGEGISNKAQEQIASLGADNIIVRSVKPPDDTGESGFRMNDYGVKRDDFMRLLATVPSIKHALPIRELRRRFSFNDKKLDGRLVGCTTEYAALNRLIVERGRFLSDADVRDNKNYCVLASNTADFLFPVMNPLGKAITVKDRFYVVIGVMKSRTPSAGIGGSLSAQDFSNDVYIPITTLWQRIGDLVTTSSAGSFEAEVVELNQITLRVDHVDHVMETADVIKHTLAEYHKDEDYAVTVPLELLEQARTTRMMFILFMGLIAAISLVVGGIGIMNIMLATVTERTREIGIRRALGAKRRDITRQFLAETVALSVVGGLTGILGGLTCGPVTGWARMGLESFVPEVMADLPDVIRTVTPEIVPWSIPLAFGISVGVGVIFGIYPAIRAAHMDPIEALRHE